MSVFSIRASELCWLGGEADDPEDRCLHGHVSVRIGDWMQEADGTVSATALYLLKTLTEDKVMSPGAIQMVPCCGHFLIADEAGETVTILGCDTGLDWSVQHRGGEILLTLPSGQQETVNREAYRQEVLRFARQVEAYYQSCTPKVLPEDPFARKGYQTFWKEWHRRFSEEVHILAGEISENG